MELKIKLLKWSAGIPVAMLNKETAAKVGIHANERISVKTTSRNPKEVTTIVDIVEKIVNKNELAVSSELKKRLGLKVGQKVEINIESSPESVTFVKKKLNGKKLSKKEINDIIKDIVNNALSGPEVALFISAMYKYGMDNQETIYLTEAIANSGNRLNLKGKFIVDKHSIGGIPGNRTTPIVISICAATGLTMPKTSSRAITTPAGTADVMETIAQVEFSIPELKKILEKTNACLVWGGALGLVPADSKIIETEKMLNIDPEAQLLASIMAKKIAVGSKYILIDIPYGKTAKVDEKKALRLKRKFQFLGKHFNKKIKIVLTKGDEPMGSGIGPVLEMIDVIRVLDPKQKGPRDLEEKSLFLSGEILELTGKAKKSKGRLMAEQILDSGNAFEKFKQIVKAQKGHLNNLKPGKFKHKIVSNKKGKIVEINNKKISSLARVAGCPIDKSAGLYIHFNVGETFEANDTILTIYAESKSRLRQAVRFYKKVKPIVTK